MLAEHKKCVPLSGYKSQAGLARCQLNTDILSGPDAALTSSPAFWVVVWPLWRSLATNFKPQNSLNNSPSGSSTVYCHTGKYSAVPFGINYLGQGKKRSTSWQTNYNRFHYGICLISERLSWVMRERWFPISLESKAETHILPSHLFWWNSRHWVGWTQLLDSGAELTGSITFFYQSLVHAGQHTG